MQFGSKFVFVVVNNLARADTFAWKSVSSRENRGLLFEHIAQLAPDPAKLSSSAPRLSFWFAMDAVGAQDEAERPRNQPFLIGVSGGTASGKVGPFSASGSPDKRN